MKFYAAALIEEWCSECQGHQDHELNTNAAILECLTCETESPVSGYYMDNILEGLDS